MLKLLSEKEVPLVDEKFCLIAMTSESSDQANFGEINQNKLGMQFSEVSLFLNLVSCCLCFLASSEPLFSVKLERLRSFTSVLDIDEALMYQAKSFLSFKRMLKPNNKKGLTSGSSVPLSIEQVREAVITVGCPEQNVGNRFIHVSPQTHKQLLLFPSLFFLIAFVLPSSSVQFGAPFQISSQKNFHLAVDTGSTTVAVASMWCMKTGNCSAVSSPIYMPNLTSYERKTYRKGESQGKRQRNDKEEKGKARREATHQVGNRL